MALHAVKEMDDERKYSDSINLLSHLIEKVSSEVTKTNLISHLILRGMITGDTLKVAEYEAKLEDCTETSISSVIKKILRSTKNVDKNEYMLDGIEKQSIFGKFEPLQEVPYLEFEDENAVYTTIEDYFNDGRYIVNLIQTTSHFHHSSVARPHRELPATGSRGSPRAHERRLRRTSNSSPQQDSRRPHPHRRPQPRPKVPPTPQRPHPGQHRDLGKNDQLGPPAPRSRQRLDLRRHHLRRQRQTRNHLDEMAGSARTLRSSPLRRLSTHARDGTRSGPRIASLCSVAPAPLCFFER